MESILDKRKRYFFGLIINDKNIKLQQNVKFQTDRQVNYRVDNLSTSAWKRNAKFNPKSISCRTT